jgi:hypothetical protein
MNEGKFLSEKTADIVEDPESYNHYIKRLEQKRNKIKERNELEKKKAGSGYIWRNRQNTYNLNYDYRNHDNLNNHNQFLRSLNQTKKFKNANKNKNNFNSNKNNKLAKSNVLKSSSSNRNKNNFNNINNTDNKNFTFRNKKFIINDKNNKNNQQNMYTYLYTSNNNLDTNDIFLNNKFKKEIIPTGKEIEFGKALNILHRELINLNINDNDDD